MKNIQNGKRVGAVPHVLGNALTTVCAVFIESILFTKGDDYMNILDGKAYMPQVKELILEYTNQLNRDLSFQQIDEELDDPSKKYTLPQGEILVAMEGDAVLGMVAYHRHSEIRCEMKRLYIRPDARGKHLGDLLVKEIIERAKLSGYKEMVLDTLIPMKAAIHLYRKYGFDECEPYYNNPMDDVIYMIKRL